MPNGHTYLCRLAAAKARFDNRQKRPAYQPLPSLLSAAAAQGLFRAPARALSLSPTAPFLPTAEEMGERTPAETAFLHFLSALYLFTATRAFPHVTDVFLIVVVPPTVPAQFSAAAAACCGRNLSSTELQPSNISYPVPNGHTYLCRLAAAKARFDNRQNRPAHPPLPSHSVSGSGASGTSDP